MPMGYTAPRIEPGAPVVWVTFWIRSNRGTNEKTRIQVPADWSEDAIKDECEQWCEQFPAWYHSDNMVQWGFDRHDPAT
jgi:hypothetical protein